MNQHVQGSRAVHFTILTIHDCLDTTHLYLLKIIFITKKTKKNKQYLFSLAQLSSCKWRQRFCKDMFTIGFWKWKQTNNFTCKHFLNVGCHSKAFERGTKVPYFFMKIAQEYVCGGHIHEISLWLIHFHLRDLPIALVTFATWPSIVFLMFSFVCPIGKVYFPLLNLLQWNQ